MPKKSRKEKKSSKIEKSDGSVDIGAKNVKNWKFLKEKLNFNNDEDFVEYLLSVAEKYLCSKLLQFDKKQKPSEDYDEDEPKQKVTEIQEEIDIESCESPEKESVIVKPSSEKINKKVKKIKEKKIKEKIPEESDVDVEEDDKEDKNIKICPFCDLKHGENCPLESPNFIIDDYPLNDTLEGEERAKGTLPCILEIKEENGNVGVFSAKEIAKYTQFGPLVGQKIKEMEIADDYSMKHIWEVGQDSYVSTLSPECSNWIRWLRPAPTRNERNIVPIEKSGKLFFITLTNIQPNTELLFWAEMTGSWTSKKMEKTSCGGCNLQFEHAMYYRMHCAVFHEASLSLTVRKYHCKVCGKAVLGKQNIMKHALLYHEGKGAYQCQFCSKFFLRLNYLEMHRNYGCSANPHRARPLCDYCGRKFCQPQKLKVHIKRMHSDLSEVLREFQCADCLKVLGSRAALQRHTKEVHKRPSGVSCSRCSKTFQNKSNLKIHMLTHSGVKPFKCQEDKCTAAFTTKQCLQFHYKKVHGLTEDRFPRIVRSVDYTFESYAGQKDDEKEDSESSDSLPKNAESDVQEVEVQERPAEPTCEETSVIEYHPSFISKASKKWMGDQNEDFVELEPKVYRRPESSNASLLVEAALDAAEKDLRTDFEVSRSPYRSPVYPSPRYERQYLTPPPPEYVEDHHYNEEVQNLSKYKYDDREIYHGFMPRYTMYEYPPDVIRAMNMQSVDLSMPRGPLIQPVAHLEERISPPYQPYSQTYIPQKSPPYHHYSTYY